MASCQPVNRCTIQLKGLIFSEEKAWNRNIQDELIAVRLVPAEHNLPKIVERHADFLGGRQHRESKVEPAREVLLFRVWIQRKPHMPWHDRTPTPVGNWYCLVSIGKVLHIRGSPNGHREPLWCDDIYDSDN